MKNHSLLIAALILLWGCGAVKKDITRTEEAAKTEIQDKSKNDKSEIAETQSETNIKKSQQVIVNDQNQTELVKEIIEPLDPTKEASYTDASGKKQVLNNAKKTTETKKEKNNTKTEAATKIDTSEKLDEKSAKKETAANNIKVKAAAKKADEGIHVERKAWSALNLLWILIPIGIVYWIWKNKAAIGAKIARLWI